MAIQLKKAQRKRVRLKIGLAAPSGGGKTASALILAYGLVKGENPELTDAQVWEKIAIIDTENGSGELYSNTKIGTTNIGQYNAITLEPPFDPIKCIEAISLCEEAGIKVCIIDSMTHFWAGAGGLLEKQGNITKRTGNSYTAWREITPLYNQMIDAMMQCNMHVIGTMRSKTAYVQDKDSNGKTTVTKQGLDPIIRDGAEYEFTLFMDIDANHQAYASKDRTSILDGQYFTITPSTGKQLAKWLDGASPEDLAPTIVMERANGSGDLGKVLEAIKSTVDQKRADGVATDVIGAKIQEVAGLKNYNKITDIAVATSVLEAMKGL